MTKKLLLLSVFVVLATATANAQETFRMKVSVPFSFYIGKAEMPAGEYDVRSHDASQNTLIFCSAGNNSVATIVTTPTSKIESQEKGQLVFNRVGGEYFLAEIWKSSSKAGALIAKTRREKEIAAADPGRETTVLYAKGR